jgi:hypothetical protein
MSELTEEIPGSKLAASAKVIWYLAWTLIPTALLWSRYRRLTP